NHQAPAAAPKAEATMSALTTQVAGTSLAMIASAPSCGAFRANRSPPPKLVAVMPGESSTSMSRQANCPPKRKGPATAATASADKAQKIIRFHTLPAKSPRTGEQYYRTTNREPPSTDGGDLHRHHRVFHFTQLGLARFLPPANIGGKEGAFPSGVF